MTAQSRVGVSKETHHGRSENVHHAEDHEDKLLRNLRLLVLFLRVPGKRLSLRANQLPMWLPQANRRSLGWLCPARRTVVGGVSNFHRFDYVFGIERTSTLAYHA